MNYLEEAFLYRFQFSDISFDWYELSLDMSCGWVVAWYELSLDMSCHRTASGQSDSFFPVNGQTFSSATYQ